MKVLILSSKDDIHAQAVAKHLNKLSADVDFFRYEEFIKSCKLTYRLGGAQHSSLLERTEGDIDFGSYASIWHRRPGRLVAGSFPEPWIANMVEREARSALDGILHSLPALWVNFPPNDFACLHKLFQLNIATEIGFSIPETLVTNKPELVREFYDSCHGQVIYKLLGEASNMAIPALESPRGVSTLPLREEDLIYLEQTVHSPHLFQRRISKRFELRVTIVGRQLFCIQIDSQSGQGKVDWRNDYSVPMIPFDLPADIEAKCFRLMERLGLNYGALDFIVSEEGEFIFLEINCAGQYFWIEQRTDFQISLQLAKLLIGESDPIVSAASHSSLPFGSRTK